MNRGGFQLVGQVARSGLILAAGLAGAFVGCASSGTHLVECPLSSEQQQQFWKSCRGSTPSRCRAPAERGGHRVLARAEEFDLLSVALESAGRQALAYQRRVAVRCPGKLYQTRAGDSVTEPLVGDSGAASSASARNRNFYGAAAAATNAAASRDDDLKNVPFPDQYESGKGAR